MEPKIPQYISNIALNKAPFRFNENFNVNEAGEANTYNNIFNESVYLHGNDVIYIEREVLSPEPIFGEYLGSVLTQGTPMRLFCDELAQGAWGGAGDMYSKFGLQIQDEATFYCPTLTFAQAKWDEEQQKFLRFFPKQSDLIYFVNGKKLFEIQHIENEALPGMYVFGNRNSYVMKCKLYTYDHNEVDVLDESLPSEIKALDNIMTINEEVVDIKTNEENAHNTPYETLAVTVIDTTEHDPLQG